MNNLSGYGFYFEREGLAGHQGPINPSEEYFKHRQMEKAIAREMIQNSLDARRRDEPCVTVEFELRSVATDAIPGIADLREAAKASFKSNQNLQGASALGDAMASTARKRVPVLRIGDYGTRGLTGSESFNDPTSALSALTRGSGVSSTDGSRGGSFGIGSAVGFAASRMRTVCYLSNPVGHEPVYAAAARFASHFDAKGTKRVPMGYFTDLEVGRSGDFQYLRSPEAFPGFRPRTEYGTDVFILDYTNASDDDDLSHIREAVIEDFMVAIHKGTLKVRGITSSPWELNELTLKDFIESSETLRSTTHHFYTALTEGRLHSKELSHVGKVKLWIQIDPERSHEIKSGVQLMRSPLMRVQTIRPRFNTPFSAVFVCDDEKGNKLLREIEPPTHDEWSERGPRSHGPAVRAIKQFIREKLSESMMREFGRELTVRGLEAYLPSIGAPGPGSANAGARNIRPRGNSPRIQESPALLGKEDESIVAASKARPVSLSVQRSGVATPDGDLPGSRGQRSGSEGKDRAERTGIPARGRTGEGRSIVHPYDVSFRSFYSKASNAHIMTFRAEDHVSGDIRIAGLGIGNTEFELPIKSVRIQRPGSRVLEAAEFDGSSIKGVTAEKGQAFNLVIQFHGDGRYRLGVADE